MKIVKEEDNKNKELNLKAIEKLKQFNKRHQKGLPNTIPNAGDVRHNIETFNNGFGNTGE